MSYSPYFNTNQDFTYVSGWGTKPVYLVTSGGGVLSLTQSGDVGIGTRAPFTYPNRTTLDIVGPVGGNAGLVQVRDAAGTSSGYFFARSGESVVIGSINSISLTFRTNAVERMIISSGGLVGIGTTNPGSNSSKFEVQSTSAERISIGTSLVSDSFIGFQFLSGTTYAGGLYRNNLTSNLGIFTQANGSTPRITIANNGNISFNAYGAGNLSTDANGLITATSDGRLKNVKRSFDKGIEHISNIRPVVYRWLPESNLDTENDYVGFIAQQVAESIPEAVFSGKQSPYLTFSDRPILAAAVNAIKILSERVIHLESLISGKA